MAREYARGYRPPTDQLLQGDRLDGNSVITEPFYRRALIEKWGSGTQKIVVICRSSGHIEPDFFEQAGAFCIGFPAGTYLPPTRVSHNLTEPQRHILSLLGDGRKWRFQDLYAQVENPPSGRTIRQDLILLREFRLVADEGRGVGPRWWLATDSPALTVRTEKRKEWGRNEEEQGRKFDLP